MRARSIHKWMGIVIGLALLMWTVTGIIMVLPRNRPRDAGPARLDVARATIAPAQAVARLAERDSGALAVRSVTLVQVLDQVLYQVEMRRRTVLVDAATGEPVEITAAMAEAIARRNFRGAPGTVQVERLTGYDARYGSGDLPAWRVTLGDAAGTVSYVSGRNGSIVSADSRRRFRSIIGKLHDFSAIKVLVSADWVHRTLAIGACLLSIVSIITGYWLAFVRPRARPQPRARTTMPLRVSGEIK